MRAVCLHSPSRAAIRTVTSRATYQSTAASNAPRVCAFPISKPAQQPRLFSNSSQRSNNWRPRRGHDPHEELLRAKPLLSRDGMSRAARSPSTHGVILFAVASALGFWYYNLETVPVSGRTRFNFYSRKRVEEASKEQVKMLESEVLRSGGRFLDDWDPRTRLVKRVMKRLIPYSGMPDATWEIRVIDDDRTANAMVLPGGKVFVFSGLIPIAGGEDGMAAVLGHEIAHDVAEHAGEQLSSQVGVNVLLWSLLFLTGGIANNLIGGTLLDLVFAKPMGRRQESEADYIGLMMMAEACYDPRKALVFWQRMEQAQELAPPEWMSTHPSNESRISKISEWMPEALEKMRESNCKDAGYYGAFADVFRSALRGRDTMDRRRDV
ncbi:peptidase family M48-domain-containing protein [Xylariaceae sp. FL1019]|nr:peptidase family M48-domain-containing protein [Xylariaceae sp. FL1019]